MTTKENQGIPPEALRAFETELGLPSKFLDRLATEDDWSFVIKAHALIEATVTHMLTEGVDERLRKVFERLELSGAENGKLVFAEALGLIDTKDRRFIRLFSELRNKLVHDIRRVTFTFDAHLKSLDDNQQKAFVDCVSAFFEGRLERNALRDMVLQFPRLAIWAVAMQLLSLALAESERVKAIAAFNQLDVGNLGRPQ
jgi:DNA-binding MltR family transcriptional regulator